MKNSFFIFVIPDDGERTPAGIRELLAMAEAQGHPLERGSYLEQMTARQLDDLVHGRTDA